MHLLKHFSDHTHLIGAFLPEQLLKMCPWLPRKSDDKDSQDLVHASIHNALLEASMEPSAESPPNTPDTGSTEGRGECMVNDFLVE